ncbi:hypothetical protein D5086_015791 [Populus alba]|uniref:Uncharacterized protein n=1 Tax=Populus alba TaxID=43335 RepID=A0ACC4BS64_POPAL
MESSTVPSSPSVLNSMVTPEEFKIFHTIDRTLYTRLTVNLDRDPAESMQVMALWIWLEKEARDNLVDKMLSLPDALVNSLADEAVLCLNCLETDRFHFSPETFDPVLCYNSAAAGVYGLGISSQFMAPNIGILPAYDPYDLSVQRQITSTENIAGGQSKAKFTINGKHVWARKYVPKNPKSSSPPKSPTSPQPTSPAAEPSCVN